MKPASYWPWAITTVFAVFIVSLVVFVVFTTRHRVHLVTPDYYEDEVAYQGRIDSQRRTRAMGDAVILKYDPGGEAVRIQFEPSHVTAPLIGEVTFYRPSDAHQDRTVVLALDDKGSQTISTKELLAGLWRVKMSWTMGGAEYYVEEVVVLD